MRQDYSSFPIYYGEDIIYLRMKALTWIANRGLMPELLQSSAGRLLKDILDQDPANKRLVVNCRGIASIDDHSLDEVSEHLRRTGRRLILINATQVQDQLSNYVRVESKISRPGGIVAFNVTQLDEAEVQRTVVTIEADLIRKIAGDCYEAYPEMTRLHSTPIFASGVYNARKIISNRSDFMWVCLLLSDSLANLLDKHRPKVSRLLAVSLRASPFAGALGILGSLDIEIVDHMGPDLKILEEYTLRRSQEVVNYIYVGDFVIGGTELKIAETYAVARDCVVDHALVIGSLFQPEVYKGRVKVHSLVLLTEARPDARYSIENADA